MAKTETNVSTLKINRGTYAKVQENLSSITENELIITSDKNVPVPTTNDSGKAPIVNASGEYELGAAGTIVVANPTLTGAEAQLKGIDIGGTQYSVYDFMTVDFSGSSLSASVYEKALNHARKGLPFKNASNSQIYYVDNATISSNQGFQIHHITGVVGNYCEIETISVNAIGDITTTSESGHLVFANPTLAGTEANLTGLQVGGTKYALSYLPLNGGTMTGEITGKDGVIIRGADGRPIVSRNTQGSNTTEIGAFQDPIRFVGKGEAQYYKYDNNQVETITTLLESDNTSANPTLAGTETALTSLKVNGTKYKNQPASIQYLTTAPVADNTDGGLKIVVLTQEPATYYNGYDYKIVEAVV